MDIIKGVVKTDRINGKDVNDLAYRVGGGIKTFVMKSSSLFYNLVKKTQKGLHIVKNKVEKETDDIKSYMEVNKLRKEVKKLKAEKYPLLEKETCLPESNGRVKEKIQHGIKKESLTKIVSKSDAKKEDGFFKSLTEKLKNYFSFGEKETITKEDILKYLKMERAKLKQKTKYSSSEKSIKPKKREFGIKKNRIRKREWGSRYAQLEKLKNHKINYEESIKPKKRVSGIKKNGIRKREWGSRYYLTQFRKYLEDYMLKSFFKKTLSDKELTNVLPQYVKGFVINNPELKYENEPIFEKFKSLKGNYPIKTSKIEPLNKVYSVKSQINPVRKILHPNKIIKLIKE
jgi:hypothetical protein